MQQNSPTEIAREWNTWLKYQEEWYTPDEFEKWLSENPLSYVRNTAEYLNPYRELRNQLYAIAKQITEKENIDVVSTGLKSALEFAEKIRVAGFDPKLETGKEKIWSDWD